MIYQTTKDASDWRKHLAKPDLHWRDGYSAKETAHRREANRTGPPEILAMVPGARLVQAIVEYPVALPGGETDSMNDVFALFEDDGGLIVCMIEAKRNEPFGDPLRKWLSAESPGKTERLAFLCDVLGLSREMLSDSLRYQLFHRTASAVLTARRYHATRAVMLVQSFSEEGKWFADYAAFASLFGVKAHAGQLHPAGKCGDVSLSLGWVTSPLAPEHLP